jgi:hypothetical protein
MVAQLTDPGYQMKAGSWVQLMSAVETCLRDMQWSVRKIWVFSQVVGCGLNATRQGEFVSYQNHLQPGLSHPVHHKHASNGTKQLLIGRNWGISESQGVSDHWIRLSGCHSNSETLTWSHGMYHLLLWVVNHLPADGRPKQVPYCNLHVERCGPEEGEAKRPGIYSWTHLLANSMPSRAPGHGKPSVNGWCDSS